MSSLYREGKTWAIQYRDARKRRTIRLGTISKAQAQTVKVRVDDLLHARITGGTPSRESSLWLRDLGPSRELLQAYLRAAFDWEEFDERYRVEVSQRADLLRRVTEIEQIHSTVILLCWERHERCHRFILKEILDQLPTSEHEGERE